MDEYLKIKSTPLKDFDIRYCIICQKKDSKGLASTANGRSKLMEAACIREDVWNRLQSTFGEEPCVYHVDNQCIILIPSGETQYSNRYLLYLFLFIASFVLAYFDPGNQHTFCLGITCINYSPF